MKIVFQYFNIILIYACTYVYPLAIDFLNNNYIYYFSFVSTHFSFCIAYSYIF